jgi:hypothetical protein
VRKEVRRLLREADTTRGDGERHTEEELPGVEWRAKRLTFVEMFEVDVGATGFGIGGTKFASDEAVAEREKCAEHGLGSA